MTTWSAWQNALALLAQGALVSLWLAAASIAAGTVVAVVLVEIGRAHV